MKKKTTAFCSIEPTYPQSGYITLLFITSDNEITNIYPMMPIFEQVDQITPSIMEVVKNIDKNYDYRIHENAVLIPITYHARFPLKRAYWKNPIQHFDEIDRLKIFMPVVRNPAFYKLLVTPTFLDEKNLWHLHATLPILISSKDEIIERFMCTSDHPVDERAKSAALYLLGTPVKFNWNTRKITGIHVELQRTEEERN